MKTKKLLVFICIAIMTLSCVQNEKNCVITGKTIGRPESDTLLLLKAFDDTRTKDVIRIPITDSSFSYKLTFHHPVAYKLIFEDEHNRGSWRPITFFPTNGGVQMELHKMKNFSKNHIEGGKLNVQYYEYMSGLEKRYDALKKTFGDSLGILHDSGNYYSDTMNILYEQLRSAGSQIERNKLYKQIDKIKKAGLALTLPASRINKKIDDERKKIISDKCAYIGQHSTIVAYYMLTDMLRKYKHENEMYDFKTLEKLQNQFVKKYKHHPYAEYSYEFIWNMKNIKEGGSYFDFTLKDIKGKEFTLSEEIKGKYAFIDIWAPWCGPCIATSCSMIPVFEDFKDMGFTIVGVACKYRDIENVKKRLKEDKYPWLTLIDPDWKSSIILRYGIENAGGGTFLVDKSGKIVALSTSADEVRKILTKAFD